MADVNANAIPLTASTTKIMFIDYDGPSGNGMTSLTISSVAYDVIFDGYTNNSYVIIDGAVAGGRIVVSNIITLGYGLLYNWFAATDARGVAPSGFRVATENDWTELANSLSIGATEVKSARTSLGAHPYWPDGTEGANQSGLSLFPQGRRDESGNYAGFQVRSDNTTTTNLAASVTYHFQVTQFNTFGLRANQKVTGVPIRCVSDTEPATTLVQDNDGNSYSWVQIGTQYWLQQSLKTTTYNNGDAIVTGLDNATWAATSDGAWAYVNGDSNLPI